MVTGFGTVSSLMCITFLEVIQKIPIEIQHRVPALKIMAVDQIILDPKMFILLR